jgi:hypothetical protein
MFERNFTEKFTYVQRESIINLETVRKDVYSWNYQK